MVPPVINYQMVPPDTRLIPVDCVRRFVLVGFCFGFVAGWAWPLISAMAVLGFCMFLVT